MRIPSPQKIVGAFNRRESVAIVWVYDEYYPAVFGFVMKMIGENSPELKDLVAEAFVRLLKSNIRFDRLARIRSFLLNTARNLSVDYLRRKGIMKEKEQEMQVQASVEEDEVNQDLLSNESLVSEIFLAISKLPRPHQELLRLTYVYGFPNDQIARQLGISTKTVANKRILAIGMLKKILRKTGFLILLNFLP